MLKRDDKTTKNSLDGQKQSTLSELSKKTTIYSERDLFQGELLQLVQTDKNVCCSLLSPNLAETRFNCVCRFIKTPKD